MNINDIEYNKFRIFKMFWYPDFQKATVIYRIRWKGYDRHNDTYECLDGIKNANDKLEEYKMKKRRKNNKKKKPKSDEPYLDCSVKT